MEGLAIVEGCRNFHVYLIDKEFEIVTDHVSLSFIQKMRLTGNNRLARSALFLQQYKFTISYIKGSTLTAADAISRLDREGEESHPRNRKMSSKMMLTPWCSVVRLLQGQILNLTTKTID